MKTTRKQTVKTDKGGTRLTNDVRSSKEGEVTFTVHVP
jgi:hypothetical protein